MKQTLLQLLRSIDFGECFAVTFPDGEVFHSRSCEGKEPRFHIRFKSERALADSLTKTSEGFGLAFMRGEIDIDGDLRGVAELSIALSESRWTPSLAQRGALLARYALRRAGLRRELVHSASHYEVGNAFYQRWLDPQLVYSCAYFEDETESLERAQLRKLERLCRKLRLAPGMRVVDCGSGWGAFALHAAREHGVHVTGYTISRQQHELSVERARRQGLQDRVRFVLDDYRAIARAGERFDRFVSVGMFEHVGKRNWHDFFDVLRGCLAPGGLALVHSIARTQKRAPDGFGEIVFPGFYFPALSDLVVSVERFGDASHVVDVENMRRHYALTAERWYQNFRCARAELAREFGEERTRMYELYLSGVPTWFRRDGLLLFQVLIATSFDENAPLTREHMQAPALASRARGEGEFGVS